MRECMMAYCTINTKEIGIYMRQQKNIKYRYKTTKPSKFISVKKFHNNCLVAKEEDK